MEVLAGTSGGGGRQEGPRTPPKPRPGSPAPDPHFTQSTISFSPQLSSARSPISLRVLCGLQCSLCCACWFAAVLADVRFLGSHVASFRSYQDVSPSQLVRKVLESPTAFRKAVDKACQFDTEANCRDAWAANRSMQSVGVFPCFSCGKILPSRQQLAVHSFKEHRQKTLCATLWTPQCVPYVSRSSTPEHAS